MPEKLRSFTDVVEDYGFHEIWVPIDSEHSQLLIVSDGTYCGVEIFATLEDVGGPVAQALAEQGLIPVCFTPPELEELVNQLDPDNTIHFYAVSSQEGSLMIPRTQEGVQCVAEMQIENAYLDALEKEQIPLGLNVIKTDAYQC